MQSCIDDYRYRTSTQFTMWSFSPEKLAALRHHSNAVASKHIASRLPADAPTPEFLTASEEDQLLNFFIVELLRAGIFCELSSEIRATAAIFMRRFYVNESIMGYPPTQLLKTCLFFGAKAEGAYLRASKFSEKFPNTIAEEIVAGEFLLAQGVRFAFDVRHPFRALEALVLELRRQYPDEDMRVEEAAEKARAILRFSTLVTDVYFHWTPSQIVLAALSIADQELVDRVFDSLNFGSDEDPRTEEFKEKVYGTVNRCREVLEAEPPERLEGYWKHDAARELKPLLRKLRKCRDSERVDLVKVQRARRELLREEGSKEKKRVVEDPFGPPL